MLVYSGTAVFSFLIVLPIAPLSLKIHPWVSFVILFTFIVSTLTAWTSFPFSQDAPLTVFFRQRVELDTMNSANPILHAVTTLSGVPEYIEQAVVSELPSSWGADIKCEPDSTRPGLSLCMWETDLYPSPGSTSNSLSTSVPWMQVTAKRLTPTSALFRVKGTNTRSCKVFFDSRNITRFEVHESSGKSSLSGMRLQPGYEMPAEGFSSISMSSRTWDRAFTVEVGWDANAGGEGNVEDSKLRGRVACDWVEYESATIGGVSSGGKIPALEELLSFMPKWVAVSKTYDGLVEAWGNFVI
jgi:hypothetical protein